MIHAGGQLEIGAAKERSLLAQLVLRANQTVSHDRLIDVASGREPAGHGAHDTEHLVCHLRAAFDSAAPGWGQVLVDALVGYALAIDNDQVDAARFERMVDEGRWALAAGDATAAASTLTRALQLWRGDALADFALESWARPEAIRLEELRISATEDWVEAKLASGQSHELVGELRQLVSEHPLRERLWGQLMVALYRCGRQGEALRSFADLRRILSEELGLEPSPGLRQLEHGRPQPAELSRRSLGSRAGLKPTAVAPRVPLAGPLSRTNDLPLHGRKAEHDVLARCWEQARAGQRQFVLVSGEPGIGKSRLVTGFAAAAHAEGATALYGRCEEELGVPTSRSSRSCDIMCSPARSESSASSWTPMERGAGSSRHWPVRPIFQRRAGRPDTERFRLFEAVVSALAVAAGARTVVLVLDDLHWASAPTLLLLKHLLRATPSMALLVIGTTERTSWTRTIHFGSCAPTCRHEPGVERLRLEGLSAEEVVTLVADAARHPRRQWDEHGRGHRQETGGNPFYVIEMVRHLVEIGAVRPSEVGWTYARGASGSRPAESVREVIERRVGRMPENSRRALTMAAVIGPEFSIELLAQVLRMREDETLAAVETATSSGLVSRRRDGSAG